MYLKTIVLIESHSVVFSYWTKTLDLIESELKFRSVRYTRLDGQLSPAKRSSALQKFQSNPDVLVFLVSLSCGGVGYAHSLIYCVPSQAC